MQRAYVAAVATALTVLATTAPASSQDTFTVTPPSGWVERDGTAPVAEVWVEPDPAGFAQNLNVVSGDYADTLSDYVAGNRETLRRAGAGVVLGPEADVWTCGSHPAHFISWKSTMLGRHLVFEQVLSVWGGRGYVFTYTREESQPPIDAARSALSTLCVASN